MGRMAYKNNIFRGFLFLAVLFSALASFLPEIDHSIMLLELLSQYRFHLAVLWVLLLLVLAFGRHYLLMSVQLIIVIFHGVIFFSSYSFFEGERACKAVDEVSVLSFNVYHLNERYDQMLRGILQADADIVLLLEHKSGFYHHNHARLSVKYPFSHVDLDGGVAQGKAIYSKYPITSVSRENMAGASRIAIKAEINKNGQAIDFIGVHTASPQSAARIAGRNSQLLSLEHYMRRLPLLERPVIVAGDFNNTPWHPRMRHFKHHLGLKNNDKLSEVFGTWPSWLPFFARLPIDHIYHGAKLQNIEYNRSVAAGSDHYSIHSIMKICE